MAKTIVLNYFFQKTKRDFENKTKHQNGTILTPGDVQQWSGMFLVVITGGGVLLTSNGKGRDAATHPTTHRAAPQPRRSAPNVNRAEEEKLVEGVLALCHLVL